MDRRERRLLATAAPADFAGQGLSGERIARITAAATPRPGGTLTEPAVLTGPFGGLPVTYVKCLLDGAEPRDDVAALLTGESWRLVTVDTGHWPMLSQPGELARILLEAAGSGP